MANYQVPLSKKDKTALLAEYYKLHIRTAPSNIKDETLIKATNNEISPEQPEQKGVQEQASASKNTSTDNGATEQPSGATEQKGAGDENGGEQGRPDPLVEIPSGQPSPDENIQGAEKDAEKGSLDGSGAPVVEQAKTGGEGTTEAPKAPEHLEVKELTEAEKSYLHNLRVAYFGLTGKPALDSMTTEQLSAEIQAINNKIAIDKQRTQNERSKNAHAYDYDHSIDMLIENNGEVRTVAKTTWDLYLSKSPDGWKPYIQKPLELQ